MWKKPLCSYHGSSQLLSADSQSKSQPAPVSENSPQFPISLNVFTCWPVYEGKTATDCSGISTPDRAWTSHLRSSGVQPPKALMDLASVTDHSSHLHGVSHSCNTPPYAGNPRETFHCLFPSQFMRLSLITGPEVESHR